jgi:acetylornithine/succinyldiaminopimelate/putrescine aminotransferase
VRLLPPLIINDQECIEVIRRFSLALDAALAECRGSSHAE